VLSRTLTPARFAGLGPRVQRFVDTVFDRAAERGHFDVVDELTDRIWMPLASELIGIRESDEDALRRSIPVLFRGFEPAPMRSVVDRQEADRAAEELTAYVSELVAERTRSPGDDLVSALLAADDEPMTRDEVVATTVNVLSTVYQATPSAIGNGILALVRNPQELARWHDDPSIGDLAVEELLRYDPLAVVTIRAALEDAELDGHRIPRRSILAVMVGAANHDPTVFEDPWRLDLTRDPNPHLVFGNGPHYCPGAALGRMQSGIVLSSFARRFPRDRLAPGGAVRLPGVLLRGLQKLEIVTN
jgi:cytochrome P450